MGRPLGTHRDLKPRMRPARGPGTWELEPQPLLEASLQDQTCGSDKGQGGKAARKQRGRLRQEPTHACRLVHMHSGRPTLPPDMHTRVPTPQVSHAAGSLFCHGLSLPPGGFLGEGAPRQPQGRPAWTVGTCL